jgi:hypothetical protein
MKKRTKKKIKKASVSILKNTAKVIFYYPAKGAWFLMKKGGKGIKGMYQKKKESSKVIIKENNPKEGKKKGARKSMPVVHHLQEVKNIEGNLYSFHKKLYDNKSTIGLILGARGTGKSAIGLRLLENFKKQTTKNIYALGFKSEALPSWISVIQNIDEIENNAVLLIDEGGIEFSSRKSMSDGNSFLSELLLIARHKDLSVLFITQNSANLEINAIRQADYLLLKPSSLLQKDFERKKIKEIYESVTESFNELKGKEGITYIYADSYRGFVQNSLPSFWSERVSKGYDGT